MRITNLFSKKHHPLSDEETNLLALEANKYIQYQGKQWLVKKIIEYNWGDLLVSYDYILDNEIEILYLGVEKNNNHLLLSVKKDIPVKSVDSNLEKEIKENEVPPQILQFDGIPFVYDRESFGKCRLENSTDWTNISVWDYIDKSNKKALTVELYGDKEVFTSVGQFIHISEISIV